MGQKWNPKAKRAHDQVINQKRAPKEASSPSRRKKSPDMKGCPVDGGELKRIAGLLTCTKCGHRIMEGRDFALGRPHTAIGGPPGFISGGSISGPLIEEE